MSKLLFLPWMAAALSSIGSAQSSVAPVSTGPFAGVSQAVSVDATTRGASGPLDRAAVLVKNIGFIGADPAPVAGLPGRPDFDITKILGPTSTLVDVDAISIGLDWILADSGGRIAVPPGHWGALTFSVTRQTVGLDGPVRAEVARGGEGAAADLFSYVLPGSSHLPAEWIGVPMRAQDSPEIDLTGGGQGVGNMDGHDLFIPLYANAPQLLHLLPPEPSFYFSVTAATAARVPASWGSGGRSGATVFASTWDRTTRTWSTPRVRWRPTTLGLLTTEDVDAIAVDAVRGRLLFSTTTAARDPLLYLPMPAGSMPAMTPVPYVQTPTKKVSRNVGLGQADEVDAVCAIDPGGATGNLHSFFGRSSQPFLPAPYRLSASAFRTANNQNDQIVAILNGWPGGSPPQPGRAVLFVSTPTLSPIALVAQRPRNPQSPFAGDPQVVRIPLAAQHTGQGIDLLFHWAAFGQNPQQTFDLGFPVRVRL